MFLIILDDINRRFDENAKESDICNYHLSDRSINGCKPSGDICLFTDNGGRLKNYDEFADFVIENEVDLTREAKGFLSCGDEIDTCISKENIADYANEKTSSELLINKTVIGLFRKGYVENIKIYKDENMAIILFTSSTTGIVGSGGVTGFYYFKDQKERSIYECMKELKNKKIQMWYYFDYFENVEIKDITSDWYFFDFIF